MWEILMVTPLSFSSGALSISLNPYALVVFPACFERTVVIAEVKVVLP